MRPSPRLAAPLALLTWLFFSAVSSAADWPGWRYDAARTAVSPQQLAQTLHLQWVRHLPPAPLAWPDQTRLTFDGRYEPIVVGRLILVGSAIDDTLTAYDTRTGQLRWQFAAEGPIRLAPFAASGAVYVASDDGHLYCLDAASGGLRWKFRGGPADRRILGNGRLISTWPARGGPVVADGVVYFAASIWPFMGTFIHALDAQTGNVIWTNDGEGSIYIKQPHNSDSFAGVAPQGPLAVSGDYLLVPSGRSVPACYDRRTGKLVHFNLNENNKRGGGADVAAAGPLFVNGGHAFELFSGKYLGPLAGPTVLADDWIIGYSPFKNSYRALDPSTNQIETAQGVDRRGAKIEYRKWKIDEAWSLEAPGGEALVRAGNRLYGAAAGQLVAIELPSAQPGKKQNAARVTWQSEIDGTPAALLAADDRLFALTIEGGLYCFGPQPVASPRVHRLKTTPLPTSPTAQRRAAAILAAAGAAKGWAVMWSAADIPLVGELIRQSQLNWVVVEADPTRAAEARARISAAGLYGHRASVVAASPLQAALPPYLACLMVADESAASLVDDPKLLAAAAASLRPYGGTLCVAGKPTDAVKNRVAAADGHDDPLAGVELSQGGPWTLLVRAGPLPGAANWTHEHADPANTRNSTDQRVKAPLGLLWFGGPSHEGVLPRHGHGPQPQVIDGRLVIEGVDMLRAMDIYTGDVLWERSLPRVGWFFDNTSHQPGANASGTNFISTTEGIYVAYGEQCLLLDLDSGETIRHFQLPAADDGRPTTWGYINVLGKYLIAGGNPLVVEAARDGTPSLGKSGNLSASKQLYVLDRDSGEVLFSAQAEHHFRHNAICAGGGRLYAVDLLSEAELAQLKRRGQQAQRPSRLVAFDLPGGTVAWQTDDDVFGTWLSYSQQFDVLVEAGRPQRDHLPDEPKGMRAYRAASGEVLWQNKSYDGPAILQDDKVYTGQSACYLLDGKPVMRIDPLTLEPTTWTWKRNYGCNIPLASTHLLTFRSGAAGYYDLAGDGGTGNFGGFRSGCTNNLIVAGGILSAPDYTRTCTCSYQNQCSVALVSMPQAEMWTQFELRGDGPLKKLALNLGAPGHRRDADGSLWLNASDRAKIELLGDGYYSHHPSRIEQSPLAWVLSTGCRGIVSLQLETGQKKGTLARYTVRLHFSDPDNDVAGRRVFEVRADGHRETLRVDVAGESGGRNRPLVKQLSGIAADERLRLEFVSASSGRLSPETSPLVCGVELILEEAAQ